MSNTIAKSPGAKADLESLRKQALDKMRQMEALVQQINNVLGESSRRPRPSPLDDIKEVAQSTHDLRVGNGNLSAERVAKLYGVSLSELATWLGRSRQTVSKTPDADSIQNELAFFERTARLRTLVTKENFLKWLRTPNPQLDNKRPLELLASGERQVVADLVDDMLTGEPA